MSKRVFLSANWLRLASANYIIDSKVLEKHLPNGTELEAHNGNYYVSLVAFKYSETRLLNVRVPYHSNFEEINLRFYVKREIMPGKWRSEVAFTKLFFPKKALTFVAKYVYKENYETVDMRHSWSENENHILTSYGLNMKGWHNIEITSDKQSTKIDANSSEFFFSKHLWGTSKIDDNSCTVYETVRPDWEAYNVVDSNISFDFNTVFGAEFKHLIATEPDSVNLFNGSRVIVKKKKVV